MSFVGDLFGLGDSGKGMGFNARGTNISGGTDLSQIGKSYQQTQTGLQQQMNFINALQGQNGIQNQSNVYNQLAGVANGTGPNPALQQLANTTGMNVANQAALMAGQRGASANAGLLARQAAMQGGNLQQQAVGQGAALQAQQQLAALNSMGNMANQQVGQQAGALQGYNQASQSQQSILQNALANLNNANVSMQSNMNNANAGVQSQTAQGQSGLFGGLLGGVGSALGGLFAHGGMVAPCGYAEGGEIPQSYAGKFLNGFMPAKSQSADPAMDRAVQMMAPPSPMELGAGKFGAALGNMFEKGGNVVPGKAPIKGDNLKNDTVPAMLSPGEVVIPRHVMQSNDPVNNAAKFVAAVLAKNGMKRG